jgi:predicted small integral membrane protein
VRAQLEEALRPLLGEDVGQPALALIDFHSTIGHRVAVALVGRRFAEDAAWFGFGGAAPV